MMYMCICAYKHSFSHELVINSNSNRYNTKLKMAYLVKGYPGDP